MRRMLIGCVGAGLLLLLALLTGSAGAGIPRGSAAAKEFVYKATFAQLIIKEKVKYRFSTQTWDAFGRNDQELGHTHLPIVLARGGQDAVTIDTHDTLSGDETLTVNGTKDPCSGEWHGIRQDGGFSVFVEQKGHGTIGTKWLIDTGNASESCNRPYDLFGGSFTKANTVDGEIGDPHLTLESEGEKIKTSDDGNTQQKVQWRGRVILERISP
jgi:hypothetical protein